MDEAAPQLLGAAARSPAATSGRPRSRCRATRRAGRGARGGRCCRARARLWSWTTNHYAPPEPYVVARPVRAVHGVRGRARRPSRWSCSASSRPAPTPTQLEVGMEMELVLGPLYEDDEHEYVVWKWAPAAGGDDDERDREIAILGVGHAPVGQVGPQLRRVRRRRRAGRARRRGRRVARHPVRLRRRHRAQRLPRLRRRARRSRRRSAGTARRSRRRTPRARRASTALSTGTGADPRRLLRRRARRRRRHDAEGLPRARTRASGATIPTGCASACSARPTRRTSGCTPAAAWSCSARRREDFAQVKVKNARHGLAQPERALPQGSRRSTTC